MKDEQLPPFLIVHKGMRTGGTALLQAFESIPELYVLMDPLHDSLGAHFDSLKSTTSESWPSHHPANVRYWTNFQPFIRGGHVSGWRAEFQNQYVMHEDDIAPELYDYLAGLIRGVLDLGRIPLFAFETSEARIPWLRASFPSAVHLALTRPLEAQATSWLQQAAYGNFYFFHRARHFIDSNQEWFGSPFLPASKTEQLPADELMRIFSIYELAVRKARTTASDLVVHLDGQPELIMGDCDSLRDLGISNSAWVEATNHLPKAKSIPLSQRLKWTINRHLSVTQSLHSNLHHVTVELDRVTAERNKTLGELDRVTAERNKTLGELDRVTAQQESSLASLRQFKRAHESLEIELANVRDQVSRAQNELDRAHGVLDAIFRSKTWRFVSLFRGLRAKLARVLHQRSDPA